MLVEFDASNNNLFILPEDIGKLTNLKKLSLNNNKLETLPKSIRQLRQLQILDLRNNVLTLLPPEVGELTSTALFLKFFYLFHRID